MVTEWAWRSAEELARGRPEGSLCIAAKYHEHKGDGGWTSLSVSKN
jgi:hypothetical protein